MALNIITAPATEPVNLEEARQQCKEDGAEQDSLITLYIKAARQMAEHETGRVLITQTWELTLDAFPAGKIELPLTPLQSITSVKYLDPANIEQTLAPAAYVLDKDSTPGRLMPASNTSWPNTLGVNNAVRIRMDGGYADAATVPENIKLWILAHVATWFRNRESVNVGSSVTKMPGLDGLLDRYRVYV